MTVGQMTSRANDCRAKDIRANDRSPTPTLSQKFYLHFFSTEDIKECKNISFLR